MESVPRTAFEDHSRTLAFARGVPDWIFLSSPATHSRRSCASPEANRLGLVPNVREEDRAILLLQPHLDEGPGDDPEAHRELEHGRGLPRQDPSPVQDVLREDQEDFRLIHEDHHLPPVADSGPRPPCLAGRNLVLIYFLFDI